MQTAFTVVFFSALHEFVRMRLNKHSHAQDDSTDGEMPLIAMHAKGIYRKNTVTKEEDVVVYT